MLQTATLKPETVKFEQWNGTHEHAVELLVELANDGVDGRFIPGFDQLIGNMYVPVTPFLAFGGYNLRPGDYLVRRESGSWQPMSIQAFLINYDPQ